MSQPSLETVEPDYDRPLVTPFRLAITLFLTGMGLWIGLRPDLWQHWLGFTKGDYFTEGQNYALYSGFLPVFVTALGLSTVVGGLWHHLNCHTAGCPRIVRHKIAGGEYGVCGLHWRQIHGVPRDHKMTIEHLRDRHHAHQKAAGLVHPPEKIFQCPLLPSKPRPE